MLSVTYKPFMLSVTYKAFMLSVIVLSVMVPTKELLAGHIYPFWPPHIPFKAEMKTAYYNISNLPLFFQ